MGGRARAKSLFHLKDPRFFRGPGKIFVNEYANFIVHKNEKLGSAGQLEAVRASVGKHQSAEALQPA